MCLFGDLLKKCSLSEEDSMIVWMLYAATVFVISLVSLVVSKEYYQYCTSLHQNRRFAQHRNTMQQALLDCTVYHLTPSATDEPSRESVGECSICLGGLL